MFEGGATQKPLQSEACARDNASEHLNSLQNAATHTWLLPNTSPWGIFELLLVLVLKLVIVLLLVFVLVLELGLVLLLFVVVVVGCWRRLPTNAWKTCAKLAPNLRQTCAKLVPTIVFFCYNCGQTKNLIVCASPPTTANHHATRSGQHYRFLLNLRTCTLRM